MKWFLALTLALSACSAQPNSSAPEPAPAASVPPLAQPNVTMEADPPPPFTYWAPEGSTIRNHPHAPGIWHAFVDGRQTDIYFGDACRASEWQYLVGQPLQSLPRTPAGMELRPSCETCAVNSDLRRNRINVLFDEPTQTITKIACY
ncbi:hypothetical protein U91I_02183 [alpha proteobacterium U9-1i]|nr:hypothetical protein U91I_02183 [alpha proteobacterium U9-1i]